MPSLPQIATALISLALIALLIALLGDDGSRSRAEESKKGGRPAASPTDPTQGESEVLEPPTKGSGTQSVGPPTTTTRPSWPEGFDVLLRAPRPGSRP